MGVNCSCFSCFPKFNFRSQSDFGSQSDFLSEEDSDSEWNSWFDVLPDHVERMPLPAQKKPKFSHSEAKLKQPVMNADEGAQSTTPSSNEGGQGEFEDDNLFPGSSNVANTSAIRPRTPQNDHLNAAAPGELSPPRSQPPTERPSTTNGDHNFEFDGASSMEKGGAESKPSANDKPGAGYKNKKAQEDRLKALEHIVDRDFSLREYGDVFMIGKQQRGET